MVHGFHMFSCLVKIRAAWYSSNDMPLTLNRWSYIMSFATLDDRSNGTIAVTDSLHDADIALCSCFLAPFTYVLLRVLVSGNPVHNCVTYVRQMLCPTGR
jgi:hypothetical protein